MTTTKKNWFDRLKRFFVSGTKSKQEKKEKRKKLVFGRIKSKCLPSLPAPSLRRSRSLRQAEDEQSKHAVAVAVATVVAAEAAVSAAQAAAEVVRLMGTPLSYHRGQEAAAIKIQTSFRGYLARSALKALKGLVKLQALIRGQAVRRQTTNTLKGLQSLMKIQSQARASRVRALVDCLNYDCRDSQRKTKNSDVTKADLQQNNERKWDSSTLSHEELIALLNNKREAAIKRERALEYASSYHNRRRPATPVSEKLDPDVEDRRWSWLDEWVGSQPLDKDIAEFFSKPCRDHTKEKAEESQLRYLARRSFNRTRRSSVSDDDSFSCSPSFTSYMASTASAKARSRSMSTPKQKLRTTDSCSEYCAPYTDRLLSPVPSVTSDVGFSKMAKTQKSPRPKSQAGPVKCRHSSYYLSFDSECSLLNWGQHNAFR